MPPPPSFDYYAELQVGRSASLNEITSAYRRLARIHHPDKNPDNQEQATAIFQRLQLAHETLSDPIKRARYDTTPPGTWSSIFTQDDKVDEDDPFEFTAFPSPFPFEFFFTSGFFRPTPRPSYSQAQAAEKKRREDEDRIKREERRQRREAKEAREKAAERSEALARRRLRDEELKKQEKRWEEMGAVSKDEKLRACLHSDQCEKVQHSKKFKCAACSAKRGMIAFECPHCSASLCQLCVTTSSGRRKKLEIQEQMEEPETPKDSDGMGYRPTTNEPTTNEPTTNEPNANEPTIRHPAIKKPKNQNTKTDKSSKHTHKSGKSGNNHKDNLERDPGLSEVDENKEAPAFGARFASDNPYDILTGDAKTTGPTGSVCSPTAGATGGYIRALGAMPMPPTAVLRQTMQQFGAVRSLRITSKRYGIAHVNFATHDGLYRATAASPVLVGGTVNVRVVESLHCHTCGKAGHLAQTCRAAQR